MGYSVKPHYFEKQEPCDDAISRDFLFKVLDNFCGHSRDATITLDTLADIVYEIPSVTQKSGKWIDKFAGVYKCSCCGETIEIDIEIDYPNGITFNYCPNCGAKMENEQNE